MREVKTRTKGTWKVHGVCLIPSDSIYSTLVESIESGKLSQPYLQQVTGHKAPIVVNVLDREITFHRF